MTQRAPLDTVSAGEFIGRNVDLLYIARAELGRIKRSSHVGLGMQPPPENSRIISDPALSIRCKHTQTHCPSLNPQPDSLLAQPPGNST